MIVCCTLRRMEKDETNMRKHVNNIFGSSEVDKDNNTQNMRVDGVKQPVAFYLQEQCIVSKWRKKTQ